MEKLSSLLRVAGVRTVPIFFDAINLVMPDNGLLSSDGAETIRKAQRPLEYLRDALDSCDTFLEAPQKARKTDPKIISQT